ncbi:MAG: DUF4381 domain-containing protein [Magnetococcales bacterium]|nr:DUF4381 domain-containing protein [Magnetococcales bacterium]
MDAEPLPLQPIHLPDPVSWWPLAPGWWLLLGLVCVSGLVAVGWLIYRKRRRVNRLLELELMRVEAAYAKSGSDHQLARDVLVLIRRGCLALLPSQDVAGLTDAALLDFLDQTINETRFNSLLGRQLLQAAYDPKTVISGQDILELMRFWCRRMRKPKPVKQGQADG